MTEKVQSNDVLHKSKWRLPSTLNRTRVLCCPLVVEVRGPMSYSPLGQPLKDQRHTLPAAPVIDIFAASMRLPGSHVNRTCSPWPPLMPSQMATDNLGLGQSWSIG